MPRELWRVRAPAVNNSANARTDTSNVKTEVATREKIGVPECDEYLEKYEACLPNLSDNDREEIEGSLALYRMLWKLDANTAEGRAKLVETCKAVKEQSKQMRGEVCQW